MPKYGLLVRYPWQDLIYCDFQIFNRWRWFSESLHQTGLINTLTSNVDFRMNTGENLYLSALEKIYFTKNKFERPRIINGQNDILYSELL